MHGTHINLAPYSVVLREGDQSSDLYFVKSGKILICTIHGTEVKAISRITPGEFVGELSFFDGKPRSSYVVTLEESELIKIPRQEVIPILPKWFNVIGVEIAKKIRVLDQVIQDKNIRRSESLETKPLSLEEQRHLLKLLTN